jgi:predicted RNA-binding protein with RPS1 domain
LDKKKVKGKIVICDGINVFYGTFIKIDTVKEVGGIGLVHITDQEGAVVDNYKDFPATVVRSKNDATILQYVNSTR